MSVWVCLPTYEGIGLWKVSSHVLRPVIVNRDLQIPELLTVLEVVRNIWRHIKNVLDAVLVQTVQIGRVLGVAKVQVG